MIKKKKAGHPRIKFIPKISDIISIIILFGIGIYMAYISWQKWADITIDFGVELYMPWQLAKGKILCRDIWLLYGPFSPYFNSLIFRVFGVGLINLVLFNIILIVVLGYVLYRIFLELTDKIRATAIVAFFLSVFAFPQYVACANYNYVCPYSHGLTHGVLLSFMSIYAFMHFVKTRSPLSLFLIGILTGIVLLTKAEVFFAIFFAIVAGLICLMIINKSPVYEIIKTAALFFIGFSLPTICFLIYFSYYMHPFSALSAMMLQYSLLFDKTATSQKFIMWTLGFDRPAYNLKMSLVTIGKYVYIFMLYFALIFLLSRIKTQNLKKALMGLIILTLIILISPIVKNTSWLEMARPLPVIIFLFGIYIFIIILLSIHIPQKAKSLLPFFVLAIFSFVALFKIILNTRVYHYGFVLAMPASLLLVMLLLYQMPNFLGKLFGGKDFVRIISMILVVTIMIAHVGLSKRLYDLKTFLFGSGIDTIKTWDPRLSPMGVCGRLALEKIEKIMDKDETFVAFPEGVLYNYLARRDNPTPYYDFKPTAVEILGKLYLESLSRNPPDYVLLIDRDTSDCGPRYFGRDYAFELYAWIKNNYQVVYQIGYPLSGPGFGVAIAKRIK